MDSRSLIFRLCTAVGIFLLVVAVFAVNVRNQFLRFDDPMYIVENQAIADGVTPRSVFWAFKTTGYASNWHPLTWISHAFDNTLADGCGLDWRARRNSSGVVVDVQSKSYAQFIHGENVFLHAANAVLLFALMLVLLGSSPQGIFGRISEGSASPLGSCDMAKVCLLAFFTLLWALHPLRVEVVAWASERKELLSVFFMLLTLICYFMADQAQRLFSAERTPRSTGLDSLKPLFSKLISYHGALIIFLLALLAKPVAVSLPAVIFAYDWLIVRRSFRESMSRLLPFAALSVVVCYLTMISQTDALIEGHKCSVLTQLLCVVEAPIIYLQQTIWPFGLAADYPFPDRSTWPTFALGTLLLLTVAAIGLAALVCRLRQTISRFSLFVFSLSFFVAWLYIGLVPMIGVVRVGFEPHSDRYTYWIGCGASVCVAMVVMRFLPLLIRRWRVSCVCAGVVLCILSGMSVLQSLTWYDTETLFSDAVEKYQGEMFAQGLGEVLEEKGGDNIAKAESILRKILAAKNTSMARSALALHLAAFGPEETLPEARQLSAEALKTSPNSEWAYAALGFVDHREERYRSAFENMKKARDLGYDRRVVPVDLDEWEREANRANAQKEKDVQR